MKISLIIPIYNEQVELGEVFAKYITDLKHICSVYKDKNVSYEIIAVNDGSTDGSAKMLAESARLNRNIRVVNFDVRYGKQAAITAGMEASVGDCVVLADVDLLNPIGVIKRVFDEFMKGHDIVYAYREKRTGFDDFKRRVGESFVGLAAGLFGIGGAYTGRPRLMLFSRNITDVLVALPAKNKLMRTMDNWIGWTIQPILFSSCYNKSEEQEKNSRMKQRFKERGGDVVNRSKVREHSSAMIYAKTFLAITAVLIVTAFILLAFARLPAMFHFFLWLVILFETIIAVMVYARAVLIKRVGIVHNRETTEIFNIQNVIN